MTEATNSGISPSYSKLAYNCSQSWFNSLKRYVQETNVRRLDLSDMRLKSEVSSILEFLEDSQIVELDLSCNDLNNLMGSLSGLLIKTKIEKLNISFCLLSRTDILSLMKTLKDTQITDLDISKNDCGFYRGACEFTSHVVQSHLTALNITDSVYIGVDEEARFFIQELRKTSLTHVNFDSVFSTLTNRDALLGLFSNLEYTSVTHLSLSGNNVGCCDLSRLGNSLRNSKLLELNLSRNNLGDNAVDAIFQAIAGSNISSLNLSFNSFEVANNLCSYLTTTQIVSLDLSGNIIVNNFSAQKFLRDSSIVSLKLSNCQISDNVIMDFIHNLNFSKLTQLDVGNSYLDFGSSNLMDTFKGEFEVSRIDGSKVSKEAFISFGKSLARSKLKYLCMSGGFICPNIPANILVDLMDKIKDSSVSSLNLSSNSIGTGVKSLAISLKFTTITHLNLARNNINDAGVTALAKCLKGTSLNDLNLTANYITSRGAVALARSLQDANINCRLRLNENKIKNVGLKALAKYAEAVLVTILEVAQNPGDRYQVESVIWNNRRQVQPFVSFCKRITSETDNCVRFEDLVGNGKVDLFLENCLNVYKTVSEQPLLVSIITQEDDIMLPKDQIANFLSNRFPEQFVWFVTSQIEANVSEHVRFLKKVEEMRLNKIVELLLLNRPIYTMNESLGILHPYVYKLLQKYKLPICNLNVEPKGIEKLIRYFASLEDVEGSADVVEMLKNIELS